MQRAVGGQPGGLRRGIARREDPAGLVEGHLELPQSHEGCPSWPPVTRSDAGGYARVPRPCQLFATPSRTMPIIRV